MSENNKNLLFASRKTLNWNISGLQTAVLSFSLCLLLIFVALGCALGESGGEYGSEITKEQAGRMNGKNDLGQDICEIQGWYGDGICDEFCPLPDPDCTDDSLRSDFHEAVAICEDRRNEILMYSSSNEEMIVAEKNYLECLRQINDTTLELVQKYADESAGRVYANAAETLNGFRIAQDEFCTLAVSAGKFGRSGGSIEALMVAGCRAEAERELSEIIGAHVEMEVERLKVDLEEHFDVSPACFEQYGLQMEKATGQAGVNAALNQLNICVSKENLDRVQALADGLIENNKTANDREVVVSGVETVFFANSKWGDLLCSVFAKAGEDRCSSIEGMHQGECSAALSLYRAGRINRNLF